MTVENVPCLNGHLNTSCNAFCGECGVALAPTCPNGHPSQPGQRFCADCGVALQGSDAQSPQAARNPSPAQPGSYIRTPTMDDALAAFNAQSLRSRFSDQKPGLQALGSFLLLLPTLVIMWAPEWLPESIAKPVFVALVSNLYFFSIISIVARTNDRRKRALTVGAIPSVLFVAASAFSYYTDDHDASRAIFLLSCILQIGFALPAVGRQRPSHPLRLPRDHGQGGWDCPPRLAGWDGTAS